MADSVKVAEKRQVYVVDNRVYRLAAEGEAGSTSILAVVGRRVEVLMPVYFNAHPETPKS